ncbi:unnamed protein product [Meganyctiphanes norvegica]|uniref:Uncharacterized protein n=1 Tax=Meganyctiphanes norvegica TaxID=48144 RepID=A0AAV2QTD9_MEGNR
MPSDMDIAAPLDEPLEIASDNEDQILNRTLIENARKRAAEIVRQSDNEDSLHDFENDMNKELEEHEAKKINELVIKKEIKEDNFHSSNFTTVKIEKENQQDHVHQVGRMGTPNISSSSASRCYVGSGSGVLSKSEETLSEAGYSLSNECDVYQLPEVKVEPEFLYDPLDTTMQLQGSSQIMSFPAQLMSPTMSLPHMPQILQASLIKTELAATADSTEHPLHFAPLNHSHLVHETTVRKRGRPKGSKNKKTIENARVIAVLSTSEASQIIRCQKPMTILPKDSVEQLGSMASSSTSTQTDSDHHLGSGSGLHCKSEKTFGEAVFSLGSENEVYKLQEENFKVEPEFLHDPLDVKMEMPDSAQALTSPVLLSPPGAVPPWLPCYQQTQEPRIGSTATDMANSERASSPDLSSPLKVTARPRQEHTWKKNIAKNKRNHGQEYKSPITGKVVPARQIGPPCSCNKKCYERVGEENTRRIFNNFWSYGNWVLQTAYLQKHTYVREIKSKPRGNPSKQRSCSRIFFVTIMGQPIKVCKQAFVSMHSICKSRLDSAMKKRTETGMPMQDLRGKHTAHHHVQESRISLVISHISSFQTISSKSSCKTMPNAKYLEPCIKNKKHMYELYKAWLSKNHPQEDPVVLNFYLEIFKRNFNHLKFHKLCKDTCKVCDSYKL